MMTTGATTALPCTMTRTGALLSSRGAVALEDRKTAKGGEGYFALAMKWRLWPAFRSFPATNVGALSAQGGSSPRTPAES